MKIMNLETNDKLKSVKKWYRLRMNGVASQSMRDKGLNYKIAWGISLPDLAAYAKEHGKDRELAQELWKENIRESKILATMMMPPADMSDELADLWVTEIPNQEIAEISAMNLFRHIAGAKELALKWLSSDKDMVQICGYHTIARLLTSGTTLDERDINELIDQAGAAIGGGSLAVRHAATNAITHFAMQSNECGMIAKAAFKNLDLDFF